MSTPINWKEFTKRIPIKASPKAIYDAWATQQGLESWFLRKALFTKTDGTIRLKSSYVEKGEHYRWSWYGYDDSATEQGEILTANGWDEIKFSFSGGCIVTVSIRQEEGENLCVLVQQMPMENEREQQHFYVECGKGWTFYMTNLKSILEGGHDLRNRNISLRQVINS